MLARSLKGVTLTTVGAQYFRMHVVVGGTPGQSTTLNMDRCQVKMGGLVNDTTPESLSFLKDASNLLRSVLSVIHFLKENPS